MNILRNPIIFKQWDQKVNDKDISSLMKNHNKIQNEYSDKMIDILPETKECIHTLQFNGIKIGCTTDFDSQNMNIIRNKLSKNRINLDSYVSSTCFDKPSRPHPSMIQRNMELLKEVDSSF